jgi:ABC-type transport system involved in multi-copper enzyme maturation permease subunit
VILLPIISRELRAAARLSFTYYLRVIGVGALLLACLLFGLSEGFDSNSGGDLFVALHVTLFCAIWILVPVLAADCISSERREGTLGLLFLTGLSAGGIVVAKGLVYGLRAMSLWLAVLPVFTIPFLLGGLSRTGAALSVMVNFSSLCWALAAGLFGSAWSKARLRALLRAVGLALVFLGIFGSSIGSLLAVRIGPSSVPLFSGLFWSTIGLRDLAEGTTGWMWRATLPPPGQTVWEFFQLMVLSVFALFLVILMAGRKTRRVWQEGPPSEFQVWLQKTFCTPIIWRAFFKRWLRSRLLRNPIGWLEQRTWSGRLVTWGWFAVVVSVYSAIFTDRNFFRGYSGMQIAMGWLMAGSIAITAAGSFRRERESGVMELLLVSPLSEERIVWGRLRGLWGQFLPAAILFLGVWLYFASWTPDAGDSNAAWFFGITFIALPVTGLYYSLRCTNFITAFLATLAVGLLIPTVLPSLLSFFWMLLVPRIPQFWPGFRPWGGVGLTAGAGFWQLVVACWLGSRLVHRLRYRTFPLERQER